MNLQQCRKQIDAIDDSLVALLCQRMALSAQIGRLKQAQGLPVSVPAREQEILDAVGAKAGPELSGYIQALYRELFAQSRACQQSLMAKE